MAPHGPNQPTALLVYQLLPFTFFFLLIFVFLFPIVGTVGFLLMLWDDHTLCYGGGGGGGGGSGTVKKKAVLVPYSYLIHIHSLGRSGKDGAGVCLSCIV